MQLSKPKMSVDFIKTFDEGKIFKTEIDLSEVELKTFIIEEPRDDVKVIYEGFKDLVSTVKFDIIDDTLHIKIVSVETTGIRSPMKLHSVFTMENKISIYLPVHFNNYKIIGNDSNLRINNLQTDVLETTSNNGSVKIKYCEIKELFKVCCDNALISLKSLDVDGDMIISNKNGVTKIRTTDVCSNVVVDSNNGVIAAKDLKVGESITITTNNGHIDLDDVYAKEVTLNAETGIVEYFNGNLNKDFKTNFNVANGVIKTNVDREEIH